MTCAMRFWRLDFRTSHTETNSSQPQVEMPNCNFCEHSATDSLRSVIVAEDAGLKAAATKSKATSNSQSGARPTSRLVRDGFALWLFFCGLQRNSVEF